MAMKVFPVGDIVRVQLDSNPDFDILARNCKFQFVGEFCSVFDYMFLVKQTDTIANIQDQSGTPIGTPYEVIQYLSKFISISDSLHVTSLTLDTTTAFKSIESSLSRVSQTTIGLINQTNVFENYLTLIVTPEVTEIFVFTGSYAWSVNSTTQDFVEQIQLKEGVPVIRSIKGILLEGKDSGGLGLVLDTLSAGVIGGTVNSGTDQVHRNTFNFSQVLTEGVTYTLELNWTASGNNQEPAIYEGLLTCMQATQSKL